MKDWTAKDLLTLANAHWQTSLMQTGIRLGIFTTLSRAPLRGSELAAVAGCDPRGLAMLLTALTAFGLIDRVSDKDHEAPQNPASPAEAGPTDFARALAATYTTAPSAGRYLSEDSPEYLGFIVMHHHHLQPSWHRLAEAVQSGKALSSSFSNSDDEAKREAFLMGMFNIATQQARSVAEHLDLSGCKRLLDLGSGPGTYAVYFCLQYPDLRATLYDKPTTRPYAERIVRRFSLENRIDFVGGDFIKGELPSGYDAVWLSQILHGSGPDNAADIVARAAGSLVPGGLLAVQEFLIDDSLDGPLFSTLFSLNMLVGTENGQAYTRSELARMMRAAGVENPAPVLPPLPPGCAILAGRVKK